MPEIECEVAYAPADRQHVVTVRLPDGATALDALHASGLLEQFPQLDARSVALGVFGTVVSREHPLKSGDRLEIYRPLQVEPREARRARVRGRR